MNKKITIRKDNGQTCYCILSGEKNLEDQFNSWYFGSEHPSNGLCVCFDGATLDVVDYYHAEKMTSFTVVSIDDTNENPVFEWMEA